MIPVFYLQRISSINGEWQANIIYTKSTVRGMVLWEINNFQMFFELTEFIIISSHQNRKIKLSLEPIIQIERYLGEKHEYLPCL